MSIKNSHEIEDYINKIFSIDNKSFFFFQKLFMTQRENVNIKKPRSFYFFIFIINILKVIFKIIINFKFKTDKKITIKKKVFFSHFNKSNIYDNKEKYFGEIICENSTIIYLNHTNIKNIKGINFLPKKLNILIEIKIFIKLLYKYYKFKKLLKKNSLNNKKFNSFLLSSFISNSSMLNLRYYEYLKLFLYQNEKKHIYLTFEGHAYERSIIKASKENKHKIFAYQHGSISNNNLSIFLKLDKIIMPDRILLSGKVTKNLFLTNNFDIDKLIIIGSNRHLSQKKYFKKNNFHILIIPNGSYHENIKIFKFSEYLARNYKNYQFYFKFHPDSPFNFNFKSDLNNLHFGDFHIEELLKKCSFSLYSSSSLIIKCLQSGLIPLFYNYSPGFISNILYEFQNIFTIDKSFKIDEIIENYFNNKIDIHKFAQNYYSALDLKKIYSLDKIN